MAKIAEMTTDKLNAEMAEAEARIAALRAEQEIRASSPPVQRLADELHRKTCDDHYGMRADCDYYQENVGAQVRDGYSSAAAQMLEITDEQTALAIVALTKEL